MSKAKTNKSAAKRFSVTGKGKIKRPNSGKRHLLTGKSRKRKRKLRHASIVHKTEFRKVKRMLPYG